MNIQRNAFSKSRILCAQAKLFPICAATNSLFSICADENWTAEATCAVSYLCRGNLCCFLFVPKLSCFLFVPRPVRLFPTCAEAKKGGFLFVPRTPGLFPICAEAKRAVFYLCRCNLCCFLFVPKLSCFLFVPRPVRLFPICAEAQKH